MLTTELLRKLIGTMPDACPLRPRVVERVDLGDVWRERVGYFVEEGEEVGAYLFVPKGVPLPRPAVLCLHQHAGQFHLGKSEPAGLSGDPDQFYALELGRRGYVTLCADGICFEDRRHPTLEGPSYERFEFTRRVTAGSSLQAKMLFDAQRAIDYLQTRSEVDRTRIGCIGHSLGGQQTVFTAALDDRVRVGVSSCGFASYATILRDAINHNFALYVPGILEHGEFGDVLALIAPRPFLACFGTRDRIFPADGIADSLGIAREAYERHQAGDRLVEHSEDGGHAFTSRMRERAYAFFDRWL